MPGGGGDVRLYACLGRQGDMVPVREVVAALADPRGPPEVVDCDRGDASLGEAEREFLIEAVEAADVGKDDDADGRRVVGRRGERSEAVAVGCLENQLVVPDRGTREVRNRRCRVRLEAHADASLDVRHLVTGTVPCLHTRASYLRRMSKQYLILIEGLVREGRTEREIDEIVREVVAEDERVDGIDDGTAPTDLPAAA
jgi:hypothetical protein